MYATCLFCSARLGTNTVVEDLPVGRRVAYDAARGRLWVVCPRCGRWNLCPFDERWEALEQCERIAERSAVREAGEELSLLRHPSGLSLVRVGKPTLAELVSWRFARSLVRRRRVYWVSISAVPAVAAGALAGALTGGAVFAALNWLTIGRVYKETLWPVVRMQTTAGRRIRVTAPGARGATLGVGENGQPVLDVDFFSTPWHVRSPHRLTGPDIGHFLARAMPYVNAEGGTEQLAIHAARAIDRRGGAERFVDSIAGDRALHRRAAFRNHVIGAKREGIVLAKLPRAIRLGLEAASHVEQEDRALSGELTAVIAEWRRAEEVAAIADNLLEPPDWEAFRGAAGEPERDGNG